MQGPNSSDLAELPQQQLQHATAQLIAMQQQQQLHAAAQDRKFDALLDMVKELRQDMREMKEANRSSSSSRGTAGRIYCPLNCGADFSKVRHYQCLSYILIVSRSPICWIISIGPARLAIVSVAVLRVNATSCQ
jgi:hypothetical protein